MTVFLAHGFIPCAQELPLLGMALGALPLVGLWLRQALRSLKKQR